MELLFWALLLTPAALGVLLLFVERRRKLGMSLAG
jgi:hypothetical protein